MSSLTLEIVGEIPADLDLAPMRKVFVELQGSEIKLPDGIINAAFIDDAQSREMNREYSGNDYATDVLSFSYIEDGGEAIEGVIGEIAVSLETAARQAEAAKTTLAEEVALLVLHGVLHIAGYDHQLPEEQDRIQQWQRDLMGAAGYVYREFEWKNS